MEAKILLSVAFVIVIITSLFWKNLLNFFLMFIPEKKEIRGIVFDLTQEQSETLAGDLSPVDFATSIPEVIKITNYFVTIETDDGDFVKIKTDRSHFFNFKKKEKFDFQVTQFPFSKELILE
ncbi:TPA: hypothetical protein DIC38_03150 [Candidatus Nomurabacteria bacterium]|nr:MAG: hypothetical protein O210_OD1C00001G0154 [Parcubacteria bacterium RAAC4_OD1_1]HCY26649.1 hypothetical protein [Candidatus Nomurabacteria bacterium]